jgi:hypothetical protein
MKRINIFRKGTHTDSSGQKREFTEQELIAAVASYDPAKHEAPIVVGHPKTNNPAFGWVSGLEYKEGNIYAQPSQLNQDFSDQVQAGAYKKVSASWYLPDSPSNPNPGVMSLRHVGFLGAQPPAIKGLESIQFSEPDQCVEFSDSYSTSLIADAFRSLRDFFIDTQGLEAADKAIPSYLPDSLHRESIHDSHAEQKADEQNQNDPLFNEDNTVTLEELQAENDTLKQQALDAQANADTLKASLATFEEQQATDKKDKIIADVEALITAGKATPAQRPQLMAFAEALEKTGAPVEFGEGEKKQTLKGAAALINFLSQGKPSVDFEEQSNDTDEPLINDLTAKQLQVKAADYAEKHNVSVVEATNAIIAQAE